MYIYTPTKSATYTQTRYLRIFSILIFLTGFLIFCFKYYFIKSSSTVTGNVLKTTFSSSNTYGQSRYNDDHYDIDYSFLVNGQNYSGHGRSDFEPGKTVTVYYNRHNPAKNRLDEPDTSIPRDMMILGILFTAGFSLGLRSFRKRKEFDSTFN